LVATHPPTSSTEHASHFKVRTVLLSLLGYNLVTASFSQQTEDRAFCPVVQLL